MENEKNKKGISSLTLHLLAMTFMLCDHLWATVISGANWLTWVGRIAFPIFAFMIAEGYHHTHNFKKYFLRILGFALLSEIPFNLMYGAALIYPFHQNVMWTFAAALLCIRWIDQIRKKGKLWLSIPAAVLIAAAGALLCTLGMTDYYGFGMLTVLLFYFLRGKKWWQMLGQIAGLYVINAVWLGGLMIPVKLFGISFDFPQQAIAMLALIPIWLYDGRQGKHNKIIQYSFYAFYPVHILVLSLAAFCL